MREKSIIYGEDGVYIVQAVYGHAVLVIRKYVYSSGGFLYTRVARSRLTRVVWHHTPEEIREANVLETYEPCIGPGLYFYNLDSLVVCDPLERAAEVLRNPRDVLEETAGELLSLLPRRFAVGLTGSILGYYHTPRVSDIDVVAYIEPRGECRCLVEAFSEVLEPLKPNDIAKWASRRGVQHSLYRHWTYGTFKSTHVSVTFAPMHMRRYCEEVIVVQGGIVKARVRLEGGCRALIWPHVAFSDGIAVVSFWGIHAPLLYEGGLVEVEGVQGSYCIRDKCFNAIILGLAEHPGMVKQIS